MRAEERSLKVEKLCLRCEVLERDLDERGRGLAERAVYDRVVAQEHQRIWAVIDREVDAAGSRLHRQSHSQVYRGLEHWLHDLLTELCDSRDARDDEEIAE